MKITANKPELVEAAQRLEAQLEVLTAAVRRTDQCATNLSQMWEGQSHDQFMQQHERYMALYGQLLTSVKNMANALRVAQRRYSEVDAEAVRLINQV